jgi:hypothetical protein
MTAGKRRLGPVILVACGVLAAAVYAAADAVQLELVPATVSACEKSPVATTVRWDASRLGLKSVRLEVNNVGSPRKVWQIRGSRGSAKTGKWAQDGYTVSLMWRNFVLKKRTLTTEPCLERKPRPQ